MRGFSDRDAEIASAHVPKLEKLRNEPMAAHHVSGCVDENKQVSSPRPLMMSGLGSLGNVAVEGHTSANHGAADCRPR